MNDPLSLLKLEPAGPGRFRVHNEGDPGVRDVVFGGQLLGQSVMAASASFPGKPVRTLHTTNGRWDIVAELRADSLEAFDKVLGRIRQVEGVATTETSLLLSTHKL